MDSVKPKCKSARNDLLLHTDIIQEEVDTFKFDIETVQKECTSEIQVNTVNQGRYNESRSESK